MTQHTNHEKKPTQPILRGGQTDFVDSGSLPVPGWPGRLLRLLMGGGILFSMIPFLFALFPTLRQTTTIPANPFFWVIVVIALFNVQHVVNLGLGRAWGRWPQIGSLAFIGGLMLVSFVQSGHLWGPLLWVGLFVWLLAVYLPLGVAFVLAALLSTPGCEMRSFNHLAARLTGADPAEHFCPGGIDLADRWGQG